MTSRFFKASPLYKEFLILDLIEKNNLITQRQLSSLVDSSVSMINGYLETYEKNDYIIKEYISTKTVKYNITEKGIERKRVLNMGFLKEVQSLYSVAKEDVGIFLNNIYEKGIRKLILYGAGEVAEILGRTIQQDHNDKLTIVSVIDDNVDKQGLEFVGIKIDSKNSIMSVEHDAILIASYTSHQDIINQLKLIDYPKNKILYFFK